MHEFPVCCGAGVDPGGKDSRGWDPLELLCEEEVGLIFSDTDLPGFEKICDGLFYIHSELTWERPTDVPKWGQLPKSYLTYPPRFGMPYVNYDMNVMGVNLLGNFPHSPYDVRENILKNVQKYANKDSVAIMNFEQAFMLEDFILSCGYEVLNRTINPKHDSKIVLYYRSPKEFKLEDQAA